MTRALDVAQRAARVAGVDRRIGLDVILVRVPAMAGDAAAALRADESDCETVIKLVRCADGDRPLTDSHGIAVAYPRGRKILPVHFDDRHVDAIIDADHHGVGELRAVLQQHGDLTAAVNDMLIGEDVTVLAQDDARSLALDVGRVLLRHVAEEKFKGRTLELLALALAVLAVVTALRIRLRGRLVLGGDDDDRRARFVGHVFECAFEVPGEIDVTV